MLGEPELEATCNGCGHSEWLSLTATARGYDERNVEGDLTSRGWAVFGDNCHLCEDCARKREEEAERPKRKRRSATEKGARQ